MECVEVEITIDSVCLNSSLFQGVINDDKFVCGSFKISKPDQCIPKLADNSLKRSVVSTANVKRKFSALSKAPPQLNSVSKPKDTPVIPEVKIGSEPKLNANDMIKIMQDFETKKKTYYCVVCKYETIHSTTIKRHVETKHMPQTISYNCLQCTKSFNLKQNLKSHYLKHHGLNEQAAKAMLP